MSNTSALRLVAVSRVLNEDDIIEAFVRHHAGLVDHHVILDNGSTDRSIGILQALQAEGIPLTVLQTRAAHACQQHLLTGLFRMAAGMGAGWVLVLDPDEFVDESRAEGGRAGGGLRAALASLPADQGVVALPVASYHASPDDDAADLLVPRRIRKREPDLQPEGKIVLRGALATPNVSIDATGHVAIRDGQYVAAVIPPGLMLARFRRRSPWQEIAGSVISRLKTISAGQAAPEASWASPVNRMFEAIRDKPASLLRNPAFPALGEPEAGLADNPVQYLGGELRYTEEADPAMKAVAGLAAFGEALAAQHARLLDTNEGARLQVHNWSLTWTRLA